MAAPEAAGAPWHLYVLRTARGALYTGVTTDVARRLHEHGHTARGARALRGQRPVALEYSLAVGARGTALRLEHALKRLPRVAKEKLVGARPPLAALKVRLGVAE